MLKYVIDFNNVLIINNNQGMRKYKINDRGRKTIKNSKKHENYFLKLPLFSRTLL